MGRTLVYICSCSHAWRAFRPWEVGLPIAVLCLRDVWCQNNYAISLFHVKLCIILLQFHAR